MCDPRRAVVAVIPPSHTVSAQAPRNRDMKYRKSLPAANTDRGGAPLYVSNKTSKLPAIHHYYVSEHRLRTVPTIHSEAQHNSDS